MISDLLHCKPLLLFSLLAEDFSADGQDLLEPFSSLGSILPEPLNGEVFDAIPDLLPTTTQCDDLSRLIEIGMTGFLAWGVFDGLLH